MRIRELKFQEREKNPFRSQADFDSKGPVANLLSAVRLHYIKKTKLSSS